MYGHLWTWIGEGGGAVTLLHNARKHVLYKHVLYNPRIAVKAKTFTILTSNEHIIMPKLQLNPNFSHPQGKRKLLQGIGYFEKSGLAKERETTFVPRNREVKKNPEGSRDRNATVLILRPNILYDLDQLPSNIKNL